MEYQLRLKELRKAAGFATQKAFADYLGIKERKYASWERGEVGIQLEDAFMLCAALKCTPNDLCGFPNASTSVDVLTSDEREIVDNYRESSPQWQQNIAMTAKAAACDSTQK